MDHSQQELADDRPGDVRHVTEGGRQFRAFAVTPAYKSTTT